MRADHTLARALRYAAPAALLLSLGACDWFTDFKDQPRIEPWESFALHDSTGKLDSATAAKVAYRGQPEYSVPITGSVMPAMIVSYTPGIAQLDSMATLLSNPTAPDARSLDNGRKYYDVNCAVCHGIAGDGRGPASLYGLPVPSLLTAQAQGYADGYLFGIIRNGRGLMPTYNRIEEMDRWDVVNYVRGLQGRYAVETGPLGVPGETGRTVPGYTLTSPTRPSPMRPWSGTPAPAPAAAPAPDSTTAAPPAANPPTPAQPGARN